MPYKIHYIKRLINEGEHLQLDFKFRVDNARKIARSLVAFANTQGGRLLIGVKDNGAIAGIRSDEELYVIDAAANIYCHPVVIFEVNKWDVDGKTVLEIWVPPSDNKPHYAKDEDNKKWAYIRSSDQNLLASPVWLLSEKMRKEANGQILQFTVREQVLIDYLSANDKIDQTTFMKLAHITRHESTQALAHLMSMDIICMEQTEHGTDFSINPRAFDCN
jgi:hypothetical protein